MRPIDESPNTGRRLFSDVRFNPAVIFSSLFFLLLAATTAFAQYTTARLSGTVQDNSGAAVPGASVTVEQAGTGYQQQAKAGAAGEYLFPSLPVGDYQLTVSIAGFDTYVQKGIVLTVNESNTLDDAIEILSQSAFGNSAAIFTSSGAAARKFRYEVPAGNIGVNIGVAAPMAYFPFSGWKNSFFGDLHGQGRDAIEFYTDKKVVVERWAKEHSRKF